MSVCNSFKQKLSEKGIVIKKLGSGSSTPHAQATDMAEMKPIRPATAVIKKRKFNLGKFEEERPILSRVPLHAFSLSFTHPVDGGLVRFEAAPPKDIRALLNQLRKWNKK